MEFTWREGVSHMGKNSEAPPSGRSETAHLMLSYKKTRFVS